LYDLSQYANRKRLSTSDESIRVLYEKLYNQLTQTNDNLLTQSRILTNELLPLIERLRTESLILSGFIEFLKNPYKVKTPKMVKSLRATLYASGMYLNATEYVEQFLNQEDFYLDLNAEPTDKWIFNKAEYKEKLTANLPVENFFGWCEKTLMVDYQEVDPRKFFSLSILLFDSDVKVEFPNRGETESIRMNELKLKVPKLKITQKEDELFQIPPSNS
jgi:hypothetical protein